MSDDKKQVALFGIPIVEKEWLTDEQREREQILMVLPASAWRGLQFVYVENLGAEANEDNEIHS